MSDAANRQLSTVSARELQAMPLVQAIELFKPEFKKVLPSTITEDQFARLCLTAVSENPALNDADRRTFFNSALKCANDGLLPDGRDAALVIFKTKVKNRVGKETWIDAVQYMPMVHGIRRRMWNSGEVISAIAEVVCRNDKFRHIRGTSPSIEHVPPDDLAADRGDIVGAYAIIKLANGEVIAESMRRADIELRRNQSRAKNSLMWTQFYAEGCCKTVLRHAAKSAPQASQSMKLLERMLDREEEAQEELEALPDQRVGPRPQLVDFSDVETPGAVLWVVVDLEGDEHEHPTPQLAADALLSLIEETARRDNRRQALELFAENNQVTIRQLADGEETKEIAAEVVKAYRDAIDDTDPLRNVSRPAAANKPRQTQAKKPAAKDQPPAEKRTTEQQRAPAEASDPETAVRTGELPAGQRLGLSIPPADVVPQEVPADVFQRFDELAKGPPEKVIGPPLPTDPKDPTMPRLRFREEDGSPRWTQWCGDLIAQMRDADAPRLEALFAFARPSAPRMPTGIWRDIERAYGERLQSLRLRQ